jgi:hypothetical protein
MKAGTASWNTDVAAETNSVSVPISDKKFKDGLRAANVFVVDGVSPRRLKEAPQKAGPLLWQIGNLVQARHD